MRKIGRREKVCTRCKTLKSYNGFNRHKRHSDGRASWCRECQSEYNESFYKNNEKRFSQLIRRRHGLDPETYNKILLLQGGVCAICKKPPGVRKLAVDHDHSCCPQNFKSCGKCVRGLLCGRCNAALGLTLEEPLILRSMLEYLEKTKSSTGTKHPG
jgi:hypothetical protein